jgi:hypothetical protein
LKEAHLRKEKEPPTPATRAGNASLAATVLDPCAMFAWGWDSNAIINSQLSAELAWQMRIPHLLWKDELKPWNP